jgi:hypothetical protein
MISSGGPEQPIFNLWSDYVTTKHAMVGAAVDGMHADSGAWPAAAMMTKDNFLAATSPFPISLRSNQ